MTNPAIAASIVKSAELTSNDSVLEIGGGLGILSRLMAPIVGHLHVIEINSGLVAALTDILQDYGNVTIIQGDALKADLPQVDKVVSNLPYSIASPITFRLLNNLDFQVAVLMYQKEFAQRLIAQPGSSQYSRLTVNFSYLATVKELFHVCAKEFYPVPAVDSTVVEIKRRASGPFARSDDIFQWMIRGIYSYPNKQLNKATKIWFRNMKHTPKLVDELMERVSGRVERTERLRSLSLEQLIYLADALLELVEEELISDPRGLTDEL